MHLLKLKNSQGAIYTLATFNFKKFNFVACRPEPTAFGLPEKRLNP